ncbi:putative secreted repeat protein (TIGR03808 family) [Rhodoligotrophos appendicifer]|uniref:TIGR03808 family TAT-translocated repetitive protein n=1 Tax=Rhodoligotrophos appendicifer TaxID=987056 RepID=UPI0014783D5E|nr:TIGR03808 family TAT-translocated repetitive protein [Rhodoligotrophos appendicifer]
MSPVSRRHMLAAGSLGLAGALATPAAARAARAAEPSPVLDARSLSLIPDSPEDQSGALQQALAAAAREDTPLFLPAGRYRVSGIVMEAPVSLFGSPGRTILQQSGSRNLLSLTGPHIRLSDLVLDGARAALDGALLRAEAADDLRLTGLEIRNSADGGIGLIRCSGSVTGCTLAEIANVALFALDSRGLEIHGNRIADIGNNGIQVWRSAAGEDATAVFNNRIERIRADAGGSGQNGNGINVFRAGSVSVRDNRITDCAFTAVRVNAGSNAQIIGNSCARLGEVALYAEFGFQGAVISDNLVDTAALGISITNFNEGGRLAVCSGNLIRNLFTRTEGEPRGIGIAVEADAAITGNVVENAPRAGIMVGWGRYQRSVAVTGNMIRDTRWGIAASVAPGAGRVLIGQNMLSDCSEGAIIGHQNGRAVTPDLMAARDLPGNLTVTGNSA